MCIRDSHVSSQYQSCAVGLCRSPHTSVLTFDEYHIALLKQQIMQIVSCTLCKQNVLWVHKVLDYNGRLEYETNNTLIILGRLPIRSEQTLLVHQSIDFSKLLHSVEKIFILTFFVKPKHFFSYYPLFLLCTTMLIVITI